ncbi:hypothetical protein [uncultured Croceitalea sp.]|uniref:hypothetical protein n=1 Tax=uncultured Croceitalea sp. TaxID=1798908 RepID=UPI00374EDD8B
MADFIILFLFLLPVIISIGLCFLKDSNKVRRIVLNLLLIINAIVYTAPLLYAYWETLPDGNMWSENGPGAALWLYFIILPLCGLALLVLLILKFVFRRKSDVSVK